MDRDSKQYVVTSVDRNRCATDGTAERAYYCFPLHLDWVWGLWFLFNPTYVLSNVNTPYQPRL